MLIDCDTCKVRGQACGECVVNLLFGQAPPVSEPADGPVSGPPADSSADAERRAMQVLADAGFEVTVLSREDVRSPLRLVPVRRHGHHAA
jgi:hypothetical protein